ncbi:MAG TPA: hypothetical protein VG815_08850 [Chloroflexota bacterium]|nr:hypothetical protein [Chloroflexota bacterium]
MLARTHPSRRLRYARAFVLSLSSIAVLLFGSGLAATRAFSASPHTVQQYVFVGNAGQIVPMANGRFLITDIGGLDRTGGQVVMTDWNGDVLWKYAGSLDIPHAAYPMSNGDVLISDTGNNRVIEVDRSGKIIWDSDNLGKGHGVLGDGTLSDGTTLAYPNDARPLSNGDILISCRLQNRIVLINRRGRILRDISGFLHGQHNPTPLINGDIFIADSGADRILEVNSRNQIDWEFSGQQNGVDILNWPRDAVPMPDGNILITDSDNDRLIEVNHSKNIVRQWTGLPRPYAASVLPNGNILVGDGSTDGVVELNRQDKIVWRLNHPSSRPKVIASWRVKNAGFEHTIPGSTRILQYWRRNDALAYDVPPGKRADMVRDAHVHHSGHFSARITYHGDSNGLYFGQTVRVLAGHRYRFSGWIKTHNVTACTPCIYGQHDPRGHTAEYELTFDTNQPPSPAPPALPQYSGTTGWTYVSIEFTVPAHVRSIGIQCELRGQGTVWFDDVWLQKLS